jgi:ppGpp synthetase/RelA/SpoT-type nucleotidyltranferase
MDFDKPLFPFVKKVPYETLAEDIVGIRIGESFDNALRRHILDKRVKKINKIKDKMKKED